MRAAIAAAFLLPLLSGCSVWFFSGESWIDRSRPVVLVETTGGDTPQDAAGNAAFEVGFCTNQPVAAKMHATVGGFDERGTVVGELLRQNGFKSARAGSKKFLRRFDLHQFTQAQKDAG